MQTKRTILILATATGALLAGGCASASKETYTTAMHSAVADMRAGDFDAAAANLGTAQANAGSDDQREKVKELSILLSGADTYCRGDRERAGTIWSESESPEIRRALYASRQSLGVSISPTPKQ